MIPSPGDIMAQRHLLAGIARLLALVLGLMGLMPGVSWLVEGVRDGDLADWGYYWPRLMLGPGMLGLASIIWIASRWLAQMLIPMPRSMECPKCGFLLRGLSTPRCPECGQVLPSEVVEVVAPPMPRRAAPGPAAPPSAVRDGSAASQQPPGVQQ